ncbi:MAG: NOL1/NOP2/sun family putative RNA methylase [Ruminococcaceae bacterium]|nr:NOL1/NOP2/sun family putative RNA methylase [Oscillospiraceae bacterium]
MLPKKFKERMTRLLGHEAEKLFDEIENGEAVKAFRVNSIKVGCDDRVGDDVTCVADAFEASGAVIGRTAMKCVQNAYYTNEKYPGSLAEHHSGAIYMQDPSAMSTVLAVELSAGMTVLDSCAAPGGKTTQLSAAVGTEGVVVANEYDASRARILQSNVERLGCKNTVILNVDTSTLSGAYPEHFDLVLCDAPCSGEGMFRKNEQAILEWSIENVKMCAERQREILANVARCVKRGGMLLYSTCTFATEENEENVAWLLDNYPEFELIDVSERLKMITSDGVTLENCEHDMTKTRRFYPHVSRGEGQFIALFRKCNCDRNEADLYDKRLTILNENDEKISKNTSKKRSNKGEKTNKSSQNKQGVELFELGEAFLKENLNSMPRGELRVFGGKLWLAPSIELLDFGVVAPGVCVGEAIKGRFVPHHQLFSAYGMDFKRRLLISNTCARAREYLYGEELRLSDVEYLNDAGLGELCTQTVSQHCSADTYCAPTGSENGWAAVIIGGCACGGGKVSGCVVGANKSVAGLAGGYECDGGNASGCTAVEMKNGEDLTDKDTALGELESLAGVTVLSDGVLKNHYPKGLRNKRIG